MLLLTISRNSYMASLITSSLWSLSDLERSKSRSLEFQSLISRKGAKLGPMLLLTINRKPFMASPITPSLLTLSDLERSKSRSLRFSVVGYLYGIDIFASSNIYDHLDVTKRCLLAGGVFCCPSGLSCCYFCVILSVMYIALYQLYVCMIGSIFISQYCHIQCTSLCYKVAHAHMHINANVTSWFKCCEKTTDSFTLIHKLLLRKTVTYHRPLLKVPAPPFFLSTITSGRGSAVLLSPSHIRLFHNFDSPSHNQILNCLTVIDL